MDQSESKRTEVSDDQMTPEAPVTIDEKTLEKTAKAILLWSRDAGCLPPPWVEVPESYKQKLRDQAKAAIEAYLSAADSVPVPKEPTLEMQKAYFDSIDQHMHRVETDPYFGRFDNHRLAYRAMLLATHTNAEK